MLWVRGLIFTALAPGVVGFLIPTLLGAAIYAACFLEFLAAGGTPAAFILRRVRHLIGEEPHLRAKQGHAYEDYCRRLPRWIGR